MLMRTALSAPLSALSIFSAEKSFRRNKVIGSRALNAQGLHRERVAAAARLSEKRRAALVDHVDPAERAAFDRDGFVIRHNALPEDHHKALLDELARIPRPAWEMRQSDTVTRVMPLPADNDGSAAAHLHRFLRRPDVRSLVGYVGGHTGHILPMLQTVIATPSEGGEDPQANLHADTFHPTAKLWLFLHDVEEEDGPFSYAPGSHRLTPERLEWEHHMSMEAAGDTDPHHSAGSFRLAENALESLGYGPVKTFPVPANTLVVADTYGFHRRTPSRRPTVRTSLYGIVRRNPFLPWNGLDPLDLPFLRTRTQQIYLSSQDRRKTAGKAVVYHNVGKVLAGDSATSAP